MSAANVGGDYRCNLHEDFKPTSDVNKWNKHCEQYPDVHKDEGNTHCIDCGVQVNFKNLKYHKTTVQGKNISLRCPSCLRKYVAANQSLLEQ